jgi:hypothetical protein
MTIFLCIVIFSELSIAEQIEQIPTLEHFYFLLNMALMVFFIIEITLKLFAQGHIFLSDFINVFDSVVVIISFAMLILRTKMKIVGLLRVLRLIKVVAGMKKVIDEKRARQAEIKAQKKQGSSMSSYVEKVLDFLEKHTVHPAVPKQLQEDIEWAIDVISANKLYAGNSTNKYDETKPEIKAWIDMISLKNIPENNEEKTRIKNLE